MLAAAALAAGCGGGGYATTADSSRLRRAYSYGEPRPTTAAEGPRAAPDDRRDDRLDVRARRRVDVKVGDTVTFVNKDEIAHTATADDGTFDSKTMEPGANSTSRPSKAGKISYVCIFHPGMTGTINVT